ncbi:hypothetical protein [Streptomyces sp. NPDC006645]|uniref:hypothetical protein n=1 Tax=unclassified Streptomyces TaxID=2593676 RepID=UPI0033B6A421
MHRFPHSGPARRGRSVVLAAMAVVTVIAGTAGCASQTGARDGGPAPSLSPAVSSAPLWPDYAPADGETGKHALRRYRPVDDVTVPSGGLKELSVRRLLTKDPNVPDFVRAALASCPGAECGLRDPVYKDLTSDGLDELVVALDEPAAGLTLIQVYRASGGTVRPVLIDFGPVGLTGETFGTDLILTSVSRTGRITTRYRWNGEVMTVENPWSRSDDAPQAADPLAPEKPVPQDASPVPRQRTGPGAGPDAGRPTP